MYLFFIDCNKCRGQLNPIMVSHYFGIKFITVFLLLIVALDIGDTLVCTKKHDGMHNLVSFGTRSGRRGWVGEGRHIVVSDRVGEEHA